MRVSTMVRAGALTAIVAMLAACADTPSAPRQSTNLRPSLSVGSNVGHGKANGSVPTQTSTFTVDPSVSQTYKFGNHAVTFPAYAICDPATSGYGEDLWDAPCAPLTTPITITATWTNKHGHSFVDFQPALRFVPAEAGETDRYVVLTLKESDPMVANGGYVILWQRPSDGLWVNEGAFDSTMKEQTDLTGNTVSRRIKHFSGYNVSAGLIDDCDPVANPDWCLAVGFILQ